MRPPGIVTDVTFSIVAHGPADGSWGVAVATRSLAVGAMVPAAELGAGALATQACTNMSFKETGLALLRVGRGAKDVVATLITADDERDLRQVGVVDRDGGAAAWTGERCGAFAGSRTGTGYAVLGNLLAGAGVIDAMEDAWLTSDPGRPLGRRLLDVLDAGDTAGGDRRGRQSAALYVVGPGPGIGFGSAVQVDLRVDDAPDPLRELRRLYDLRDRSGEP
jgi:uncharacterized Ntn-hydrolase superfamily protein